MAIQQHPVPQDISNYKFRLIGDMTIKQFAALGISIVLSVMTYSAPLPFFFKYPISFILLLLGVGTAFVPFQGRTLDVWIVAFIKSIYSPTQYIWKHGQETPVTAADNSAPQTPIVNVSPPATDTPPMIPQLDISTVAEKNKEILNSQPTTIDTVADTQINSVSTSTPPQPTPTPTPEIVSNIQTDIPLVQPAGATQPTLLTAVKEGNERILTPSTSTPPQPAPTPTPTPEIVSNIQTDVPLVKGGNEGDLNIQPTDTKSEPEKTIVDNIQSLPIPFTPTTPNTLVGLTLTPSGQTLDGVLVEIKNQNITVRATKSNKLGQFLFVRPLENGLYQILAEKDGFQFESYSIQLSGEIINPLRIQAIN